MTNDSQYTSVCSVCGHPLETWQIAGSTIETTLVDYEKRALADITLEFCSECLQKVVTYSNSTVEEAFARMEHDAT